MRLPSPDSDAGLQQRLTAIEIDLSSALAINAALLRSLTASSPRMRHIIDRALDDALEMIAAEDRPASGAVRAVVAGVRKQVAETSLEDRLAHDLERLLIEAARTAG